MTNLRWSVAESHGAISNSYRQAIKVYKYGDEKRHAKRVCKLAVEASEQSEKIYMYGDYGKFASWAYVTARQLYELEGCLYETGLSYMHSGDAHDKREEKDIGLSSAKSYERAADKYQF